jgi:hypothetical protein
MTTPDSSYDWRSFGEHVTNRRKPPLLVACPEVVTPDSNRVLSWVIRSAALRGIMNAAHARRSWHTICGDMLKISPASLSSNPRLNW